MTTFEWLKLKILGQRVMWRRIPHDVLHTYDEQKWPAQPHSLPLPNRALREASSVSELDAFLAIGEAWSQMTAHYLPENPRVVDIGCGCGKLARFYYLIPGLTYLGIDVFAPSIRWCNKVFKAHADRFEFIHFDGHSELYNPTGAINPSEYELPVQDNTVDMTVCASLFTHLFEKDARHYLEEIARITRPRGQAIVSIHTAPEGAAYSGDEVRIDVDPAYFASMCEDAGLSVAETIGVIYGQTALRLVKP